MADPWGFRPISLSITPIKLVAKGARHVGEAGGTVGAPLCVRGVVAGRSMMEKVVRTLDPMHRALRVPTSHLAIVFVSDITAAFPSLVWDWI